MNNIKICVYAICKNQSKNVKLFLDSVLSEADYVSILDLNSTDDTYKQIKERNDSRIILNQFDFKEKLGYIDYSEAKNFAMHQAPLDTDVLVCLDISEIPHKGWSDIIKEVFSDNQIQSMNILMKNIDDDTVPMKEWVSKNVHRNNQYWFWSKMTNEKLDCVYPYYMECEEYYSDKFVVDHYKNERDISEEIDILNIACNKYVFDPYYYYQLSLKYKKINETGLAIEILERALLQCKFEYYPEMYMQICIDLADLYKNITYDRPIELLNNATMLEPDKDTRYRHMVYARVYENFDYVDEALNSLFEALQIQSSSTDWREDQSLYQGYIEDKIALLYYYRKHDILKALEFGSRALQYNPNDEHLKMNYILYFKEFTVENGGEVNE